MSEFNSVGGSMRPVILPTELNSSLLFLLFPYEEIRVTFLWFVYPTAVFSWKNIQTPPPQPKCNDRKAWEGQDERCSPTLTTPRESGTLGLPAYRIPAWTRLLLRFPSTDTDSTSRSECYAISVVDVRFFDKSPHCTIFVFQYMIYSVYLLVSLMHHMLLKYVKIVWCGCIISEYVSSEYMRIGFSEFPDVNFTL